MREARMTHVLLTIILQNIQNVNYLVYTKMCAPNFAFSTKFMRKNKNKSRQLA